LSGVAQAVHLAGGLENPSGTPIALRLGVGAWPAIAAAVAAHLLHLIRTGVGDQSSSSARPVSVQSAPVSSSSSSGVPDPAASARRLDGAGVQLDGEPVTSGRTTRMQRRRLEPDAATRDRRGTGAGVRTARTGTARDRAAEIARRHRDRHARLPTTTELARLADTSRSTAGAALKALRAERGALRVVSGHVAADLGPASSGDTMDALDLPSRAQTDP